MFGKEREGRRRVSVLLADDDAVLIQYDDDAGRVSK
jgi:hypothetical protein